MTSVDSEQQQDKEPKTSLSFQKGVQNALSDLPENPEWDESSKIVRAGLENLNS